MRFGREKTKGNVIGLIDEDGEHDYLSASEKSIKKDTKLTF